MHQRVFTGTLEPKEDAILSRSSLTFAAEFARTCDMFLRTQKQYGLHIFPAGLLYEQTLDKNSTIVEASATCGRTRKEWPKGRTLTTVAADK